MVQFAWPHVKTFLVLIQARKLSISVLRNRGIWIFGLSVLLMACSQVGKVSTTSPIQPEASSNRKIQTGHYSKKFSISAANPLATQAGYDILKKGGSAVDAVIATQMVLGLVEPQSSGLGGGSFLVYFDGNSIRSFDGRETAPELADPNLFLNSKEEAIKFIDAVTSGRSVGVPGTLNVLALVHKEYGKLPWESLFTPAINLATNGFLVSERMQILLKKDKYLKNDPVAETYFFDESGKPWKKGHLLKNPEYAAVLRLISKHGSKALMSGEIAQAIVNKVQNQLTSPGLLSLHDLENYQAKERPPLCFNYSVNQQLPITRKSEFYKICGMGPPSSGTLAVGQILNILNKITTSAIPLKSNNVGLEISPDWIHLYIQASKLSFADRAKYLADPDFVSAPLGNWESLLDNKYLTKRSALIDLSSGAKDMKKVYPGKPGEVELPLAQMLEQPEHGTSHISIVDAYGHALSMTSTIENAWGSKMMVNRGKGLKGGFLLNNELTDFSFKPKDNQGHVVANRVEGGKRPRSSMSPLLVFNGLTGELVLVTGSPGGAFIIHFTAKTLYGLLNWRLNVQQAINLPNFGSLGGETFLENNYFSQTTLSNLIARGHNVKEIELTSGIQAIQKTKEGWFGGADSRREGLVLGD